MHGGLKKLIPTNSIFCGAPTWATKKGHIQIVWYFHDVIGSMTAKAVPMGPACPGTEDNSGSLCQAQSSFRDAPYSNMILYSFIFPSATSFSWIFRFWTYSCLWLFFNIFSILGHVQGSFSAPFSIFLWVIGHFNLEVVTLTHCLSYIWWMFFLPLNVMSLATFIFPLINSILFSFMVSAFCDKIRNALSSPHFINISDHFLFHLFCASIIFSG